MKVIMHSDRTGDRKDACSTSNTGIGSTGFGSVDIGSTGFQPVESFKIYRRNLPHFESPGSVYFITFRTFKNLVLPEVARDIVFNSILYWNNKKFNLYTAVIMPNHAHLILQPLEKFLNSFFSLSEILHSIKSYSSNKINKILKRSGTLWLDENFDRIVRDEEELVEKINYIINNPLKSGLVSNQEDYKWLYWKR